MSYKKLASYLSKTGKRSSKDRKSAPRHRHGGRGASYVPRLDALEDRRLLAVTVSNMDDTVNGDVTSIDALVAKDGGDGISLREAVTAANNTEGADVIDFAPSLNGTISLTNGQLDVVRDLTIDGPGQGKLTISGGGQSRVFDVANASLAIDQLTIADGHAVYDGSPGDGGGAIRANESVLNLEHVILENNRFEGGDFGNITGGGAIKANASSVTLDRATVRNNEATNLVNIGLGGAILTQSSLLQVSHSDFSGNRIADANDAWGGAIGSRGGSAVISHSRFDGNQADGVDGRARGGAIMATTGGSLDVDHSRFMGNSAVGTTAQGGAIVSFQAVTSRIAHSQFVHNSADGDVAQGGAIWNFRGFGRTMTLEGNSIVNNEATGDVSAEGGGIYNGTDVGPPSSMTITQTNINANRAIGADDAGTGIGGGVFNIGLINIDKLSNIHGNKASTSHDDVFGNLSLLEDLVTSV